MVSNYNDTIFAVTTGTGRSPTAMVRISGTRARHVPAVFGFDMPETRRAGVRVLEGGGRKIDEAIIIFFKGPQSYTGEDVLELQLHGGKAVIEAVLSVLGGQDHFRAADPGEFSRRAVINGRIDLTEAEGINDLISAETEAQRAQSFSQMEGGVARKLMVWRDGIVSALAHIEAYIDFPEEDVPEETVRGLEVRLGGLLLEMRNSLEDGRRGEILREGLKVAVIGPPNAGKSTLVNWMAKRDLAITSNTAGTTRDVIEVRLDLDGYPVVVADTAGLRKSSDPIELEGIRRARNWAEQADIRILVLDAAQPDLGQNEEIRKNPDDVVLVNKIDLLKPEDTTDRELKISLKEGSGLEQFLGKLKELAQSKMGGVEPAIVTRVRHRKAMEESVSRLQDGIGGLAEGREPEIIAEDVRAAVRALGRITGEVDIEDLLEIVFRDFCIGK